MHPVLESGESTALFSFLSLVSSDYAHGITMLSPFTSEKKQLVSFCSPSGEELRKFAEELREAITEVNEMEQIHIQCKAANTPTHSKHMTHCDVYVRLQMRISCVLGELERQQGIQPHGIHTNGGQVDVHTGHGSPSGTGCRKIIT